MTKTFSKRFFGIFCYDKWKTRDSISRPHHSTSSVVSTVLPANAGAQNRATKGGNKNVPLHGNTYLVPTACPG